MKAFVTGATGFIGGRLARRLVERGYDVHALVRSSKDAARGQSADAADLQAQGITPVIGDLRDKDSMREGMRGSDVVFHLAAWYKIGVEDPQMAEEVNVEGTRSVIELARELGVPKIVYTSTLAVYGDTHGRVVDESEPRPTEPFLTEYDRTKSMAHFDVALPMIEQGAPIVIVLPGGVYGPGDPSLMGEMMRSFFQGQFVVFPAPNMTLTFAHVDDIVEGHILAAEKGRPGESYILAGPIYNLFRMAQIWAQASGRPAPLIYLPTWVVKPFAPVLGALGRAVRLPPLLSEESARIVDATYTASAEKAKRELGWQVRPVMDGMRQTFAAMSQTIPVTPEMVRKKQTGGFLVAAVTGLLMYLFLSNRRK